MQEQVKLSTFGSFEDFDCSSLQSILPYSLRIINIPYTNMIKLQIPFFGEMRILLLCVSQNVQIHEITNATHFHWDNS
jgi:hypothetical protein